MDCHIILVLMMLSCLEDARQQCFKDKGVSMVVHLHFSSSASTGPGF